MINEEGQLRLPWVRFRVDVVNDGEGWTVMASRTIEYGSESDENDPSDFAPHITYKHYEQAIEQAKASLLVMMRIWT